MRAEPLFSIILSTYGRGGLIKPTIESVLRQSFGDFELIVVGDGCADDTEQAVASFASDRISWRSLAQNSGSQSAPNNEGLRHARGDGSPTSAMTTSGRPVTSRICATRWRPARISR